MGPFWTLVCSTAFVWVFLGSASGESIPHEHITEQREVDLDEKTLQDLMYQRPVDLTELLEGFTSEGHLFQPKPSRRGSDRSPVLTPRGFLPERYPVQFPLGRPTSDNLQAICLYGDRRPRYPKSYFPRSGFGSQVRMGRAVNKAESRFSICCKGNQTWEREVTLCCATKAWELSIKSFCKEEFSVKTSHYHCCKQLGKKRLNCFNNNAPNPNYGPTEKIPVPALHFTANFNFDPSICKRNQPV